MGELAEAAIPWFGARKFAGELQCELREARHKLETLGVLPVAELQSLKEELEDEITA